MRFFDEICKPTLLLDERIARANIRRMAAKARASGVVFRPHFKTHQSSVIGEWFRDEGVHAITVSSLDMAAAFAEHGWQDITLAFTANLRQAAAMDALAQRVRLGLLVESTDTVERLAQAIAHPVDLWLKIDVGAGRTGISWQNESAAADLLERALAYPSRFHVRGLLTHAGHAYAAATATQAAHIFQESTNRIDALRRSLSRRLSISLLASVGDTPGCSAAPSFTPAEEIRPGNFVFFDAEQYLMGSCAWQDIAVALACPVVALHPDRSEAVVYGGAVHLSKDVYIHQGTRLHGLVSLPDPSASPDSPAWSEPLPDAYVDRLSQEHGILRMPPQQLSKLHIGDLVCILPVHSCLTVSCMRRYLTLSGAWIEVIV